MPRFVTVLVLACLASSVVPEADACLRKMPKVAKKKVQVDPTRRDVVAAEKALAKGDPGKAAELARRAVPGLDALPPVGAAELATRAQRTLALAVIRSGGATRVSDDMPGKTADEQKLNVAWAQLVLHYHAAMNADNVVMQVQLAEALASTEPERAQARDILRDLSTRDVMPTASGYALLAQLESDAPLRDAALSRCRELGGTTCKA